MVEANSAESTNQAKSATSEKVEPSKEPVNVTASFKAPATAPKIVEESKKPI